MKSFLTDSLIAIQNYRSESPPYKELLDILEEILILRAEYRARITEDIFCVEDRLVPFKISGGLPLVDFSRRDINLSKSREYFFALLKLMEKRSGDEIKEILDSLETGEIDYEDLVCQSFEADAMEAEPEESEEDEDFFDLLGFLVEESLRPALEVLAERFDSLVKHHKWSEGFCPICGREPKIGRLVEKENGRMLFCNQCGYEWLYQLVKCPFCNNEDEETLACYVVEDEERYRVDVCNRCNRYVKTVDFRNSSKTADLDVEDIATLHLDILANDEGYT
ncbi:MAG: formate dehydrogenase accessory protein FdhE [Deltaproteobacteria bacterium]|nr:formate dehydrogenase accessory protein FdhE [Deltaproteobacteria bacterium]